MEDINRVSIKNIVKSHAYVRFGNIVLERGAPELESDVHAVSIAQANARRNLAGWRASSALIQGVEGGKKTRNPAGFRKIRARLRRTKSLHTFLRLMCAKRRGTRIKKAHPALFAGFYRVYEGKKANIRFLDASAGMHAYNIPRA